MLWNSVCVLLFLTVSPRGFGSGQLERNAHAIQGSGRPVEEGQIWLCKWSPTSNQEWSTMEKSPLMQMLLKVIFIFTAALLLYMERTTITCLFYSCAPCSCFSLCPSYPESILSAHLSRRHPFPTISSKNSSLYKLKHRKKVKKQKKFKYMLHWLQEHFLPFINSCSTTGGR